MLDPQPTAKDYLALYDAAPDADKYPLVRGWMKTEPLAFFKQLREQRPVLVTPVCTLVANFVDVRDMLMMPKVITVDLYKPKMGVTGPDDGFLMAHDDNALHYREKSLMQGLLNRKDLPRVRAMVAETASEILDEAGGSIELVQDYCRTVPVCLVQDYFGLDGIGREELLRWSYWNQYDAFNNQPIDLLSDQDHRLIVEKHADASREIAIYIKTLLLRKGLKLRIMGLIGRLLAPLRFVLKKLGREPKTREDTMVERMLRSKMAREVDFPIERVGLNAGGLLIGAVETTSQAVAQAVEFFLDRPDLLRQAKDKARGSDVAAFDAMVWEALRFVPIRPDIFRQASEDFVIGKGTSYETEIEAGTIVRLLILSAMFDPFAYRNPDAFDPDRSFYHNFILGFGPHECLGKYVGMELVPEMVRQVLLRDNLAAAGPIDFRSETFPDRDGPFPEKYEVTWAA